MLSIERVRGERVLLRFGGARCWVTVVSLGDGRARLAFEAPDSVLIDREERLPPELRRSQIRLGDRWA